MDAPTFLGRNASKMEKKPYFSPGFSFLKNPWRDFLEVSYDEVGEFEPEEDPAEGRGKSN